MVGYSRKGCISNLPTLNTLIVVVVIAVLAQVATREGDDVATFALGADADRVSHLDWGLSGEGLGVGGNLSSGNDGRAHCECGLYVIFVL